MCNVAMNVCQLRGCLDTSIIAPQDDVPHGEDGLFIRDHSVFTVSTHVPEDVRQSAHLHHYRRDRHLLLEGEGDVPCDQAAAADDVTLIQRVEVDGKVLERLAEHLD